MSIENQEIEPRRLSTLAAEIRAEVATGGLSLPSNRERDQVRRDRPTLLEAHHLARLRDGGANDPSNGVCVGRHHHRAVE